LAEISLPRRSVAKLDCFSAALISATSSNTCPKHVFQIYYHLLKLRPNQTALLDKTLVLSALEDNERRKSCIHSKNKKNKKTNNSGVKIHHTLGILSTIILQVRVGYG